MDDDVLLGRQRLLERAVDHLERDGGVVLAGLPWVGRTRLLREALARVDGPHVMIRATVSGRGTPFGNLGPLAPRDPGTPVRWLDDLTSNLPSPDAIVAVDGAQFLDDQSALLLLRAAEERAVRLAVSVWKSHPAPDAVTSLWTDGLLPRLDVEPVDRPTSDDLVRQAVGGSVEEATLLWMWHICRGYPLLIREYVAGSRAAGLLVERDGLWVCRDRPVYSPTLVDTGRQVRIGLSPEAVEALELLAVAEPLAPTVADRLVATDVLDQLERWDLYVLDPEVGYRTPAPGWAEALRGGLSSAVRRRLSGRLADAFPPVDELEGADLVRVVRWHRESGRDVAVAQMLRAAEVARELGRIEDAAELAAAAEAADPVRARMVLSDARARSGDVDGAVRLLVGVAEETRDHTVAARALIAAARLEFFRRGRTDAAVDLLHDGLRRTDDVEARALVHAELGLLYGLLGNLGQALEMARPVTADQERSADVRLVACRAATVAAMWSGRLTEARSFLTTGRTVATAVPTGGVGVDSPPILEFCEPVILLTAGRPRQALERSEAGYAAALAADELDHAAVWSIQSALTAVHVGDPELAATRSREAVGLAERGESSLLTAACGARALAAAVVGDATTARHWLGRLDGSRLPSDARAGALRYEVAATLRALDGDVEGAARSAAKAGEEAAARGQNVWAGTLLHMAVRYGYAELACDALAEVCERVEGELSPLWAGHARALASGDAEALERTAEALLTLGYAVQGTEALVHAGEAHARAGRRGRAGLIRARAARLAEGLGAIRTPALRGIGTEPLTRREREVALLAAEGRTSPEIADQLVVSVRTVDNHLSNVYRKLGIAGRHELGYVLQGV